MVPMDDAGASLDAKLLAAARQGDSRAFAELVGGYRQELYGTATG